MTSFDLFTHILHSLSLRQAAESQYYAHANEFILKIDHIKR